MSPVRRPEPGEAALRSVPLVEDVVPEAELRHAVAPAEFLPARDSHLMPCRRCGVLNGRSAASCWGCEADLSVVGPFAPVAAARPEVAKPEPARPEPARPIVTQPDEETRPQPVAASVDGRHGLHLVSRAGGPVSVDIVLDTLEPTDDGALLPSPLTDSAPPDTRVAPVPMPMPMPMPPTFERPRARGIIAALVAAGFVGAGAYWRYRAPAAVAVAPQPRQATAALPNDAALVPFAAKPVDDSPRLSFPPLEVVPEPATVGSPAGGAGRPRAPSASTAPVAAKHNGKPHAAPRP